MTLRTTLSIVLLAMLIVPSVVGAVSIPYWPSDKTPLLKCTGIDCTSLCQFIETINRGIAFMLTVLLEAVAPLLIIYGGFVWFFSGGSADRIALGKRVIIGTVIGIVIGLAAYAVISWFMSTIGASGIWTDTASCDLFNLDATSPPPASTSTAQ